MILKLKKESDRQLVMQFKYLSGDVLEDHRERLRRASGLMKASLLDSISAAEVVLFIRSAEDVSQVHSRVIAVGDERVMLEEGVSIPVTSIMDVVFN